MSRHLGDVHLAVMMLAPGCSSPAKQFREVVVRGRCVTPLTLSCVSTHGVERVLHDPVASDTHTEVR